MLGSIFGLFTFALFTFYLSADGPRLRRWLASLFPERGQAFFFNVWDITAQKTGGYIGARVILAFINSFTTGIVFFLIGMPYWLALAIWTGVVAQFVPTIGTYIAIIPPVIVGLCPHAVGGYRRAGVGAAVPAGGEPDVEPRISAGRQRPSGGGVRFRHARRRPVRRRRAFLAIPVIAMMLSLLDIYAKRHEIIADTRLEEPGGGDLSPEPAPA